MSTIYDPLPLEVQDNLAKLKADLDEKIPSKELDKNLLIASWNIRAFGNLTREWMSKESDSPRRDLHSIFCIAEILRRFDVIAVQEVKSNLRALRDTLKLLGDNWSMILTDTNKGSSGNEERMAYLFDTRRLNLSGLAGELVIPNEWVNNPDKVLKEQFVRSPYAVSFRAGKKTFILVTVHIKYGKSAKGRQDEIHGIAKWLSDWATDVNAYDQNLIVLGDFNIEARGDFLDKTFLSDHTADSRLFSCYEHACCIQTADGSSSHKLPRRCAGHPGFRRQSLPPPPQDSLRPSSFSLLRAGCHSQPRFSQPDSDLLRKLLQVLPRVLHSLKDVLSAPHQVAGLHPGFWKQPLSAHCGAGILMRFGKAYHHPSPFRRRASPFVHPCSSSPAETVP